MSALAWSNSARAAVFNIADGDVTGLITAINTANANGEPDTINLAADGTYTLTAVDNDTNGPNGLPSITSEITINGNGAIVARVTDRPVFAFRLVHVSLNGDLTVTNCTITGGLQLGDGGAIFNQGGTLMLSDTVVSENTAMGQGGGVFNAGTLECTDTTIVSNGAESGGGVSIAVGGVAMLVGGAVSGNSASGDGGGFHNHGSLTLNTALIAENISDMNGGGIHNSATLECAGAVIENNNAVLGGGMFNEDTGAVSLFSSSVDDNFANRPAGPGGRRGAGIYNRGGNVAVASSSVSNNTCPSFGGGIVNSNSGAMTLDDCCVCGNASRADAGGILNSGSLLTVVNSSVNDNTTRGGNFAGGVYNAGGTLTMTGCTISGNDSGLYGGGIFNLPGGSATATLVNCTVSNNQSLASAGIENRSTLDLINCTVSGNFHPGTGFGGGIGTSSGTTTLSNTIVANNDEYDCRFSSGIVVDDGHNIIEDGSCITDPTSMSGDPMLGPLADNGGPTTTHALIARSRAINAGDCAGGTVLVDQRGVARPQAGQCDVGAFELEIACDAGACPEGTTPLFDDDGEFAGWCFSASDPEHADIYVDNVVPNRYVLVEISRDFVAAAPRRLTFQQVCPDDSIAVPAIIVADESITNLSGVEWAGFTWRLPGESVWFDVSASAEFTVSPPFATRTFDEFLDPPSNQRAHVVRATDGVVPPYSSFFPGYGMGSLKIVPDLSAINTSVFVELVQSPSADQVAGDFDADGDVDTIDFARFALCFGGANAPPAPACPPGVNADLDGDGDADASDFIIFTQNFTGSR